MEPYDLELSFDGGPVTIALLANGFPDSVPFLEEVELALKERLPEASVRHWNKGDASSTASGAMLDAIEAETQAVIAAYGH